MPIYPLTNSDLSPHLSMHLKTQTDEFIEVFSKDDLVDSVRYAISKQKPYVVLGGGSNTVAKQSRYFGIVIKNSFKSSEIIKESSNEIILQVSSGYPMSLLVSETVEKGWGGLEYHKGLPGTVGGAIVMNSKWTQPVSYVSDCLEEAILLDLNGIEKKVNKNYFNFSYGYSLLQVNKEILVSGIFRLTKVDQVLLKDRSKQAELYRQKTQPYGVSTSGCFFKNISETDRIKLNINTKSAGYLIDQCGLKGMSVGNFEVSRVHANFILNSMHGESKPKDLLTLVTLIKKKVYENFGIQLMEEVISIS